MEWHPTNPNILAVGSKGGDIMLWDTANVNNDKMIQGVRYTTMYSCFPLESRCLWMVNSVYNSTMHVYRKRYFVLQLNLQLRFADL